MGGGVNCVCLNTEIKKRKKVGDAFDARFNMAVNSQLECTLEPDFHDIFH